MMRAPTKKVSLFRRTLDSYARGAGCVESLVPELAGHGHRSEALRRQLHHHHAQLERRLGRSVAFAVATADFMQLNGGLANPIVVSEEHYLDLQRRCMVDAKSGLFNFATFVDRLRDELSRAERHGHQLSLIMMDIDGLKGVNDRLGHLAGDDVIVNVAQALRATVRTTDTCARYGGDEFAVIAPHTDERAAAQLAQRILERARGVLRHDAGLSLGVAGWPNGGHTALTLIAAADAALYASKRAGGDRVTASAVRRHSATA